MAKTSMSTGGLSLHSEAKSLRNAVFPYVAELKRSASKEIRISKKGSADKVLYSGKRLVAAK